MIYLAVVKVIKATCTDKKGIKTRESHDPYYFFQLV